MKPSVYQFRLSSLSTIYVNIRLYFNDTFRASINLWYYLKWAIRIEEYEKLSKTEQDSDLYFKSKLRNFAAQSEMDAHTMKYRKICI